MGPKIAIKSGSIPIKLEEKRQEKAIVPQQNPNNIKDELLSDFPMSYLILDAFETMSPLQKQHLQPSLSNLLKKNLLLKKWYKEQLAAIEVKLENEEEGIEPPKAIKQQDEEENIVGFQLPSIGENQIQIANLISSFSEHSQELRKMFFEEDFFKYYNDF